MESADGLCSGAVEVEVEQRPQAPPALVKLSGLVCAAALAGALLIVVAGLRMHERDPSWGERQMWTGGVAALIFLGLLRLRAEARIMAALSLLAVGFACFCANAYFLMQPPSPSLDAKIDAARAASGRWDKRSVLEVVHARNKVNKPTVPAMLPCNVLPKLSSGQLVPLAGISTSTTVLCNELGEHAIYRSDQHGFNNPLALPAQVDIALIGDSFVHGSCVPGGKDLASVLRRRGYSVINLGTAGSGPLLELAILMEYGLRRKPKLVLWVYVGNDLNNLTLETDNEILRRYLWESGYSQGLVDRQAEIDAFWRAQLKGYKPPASPKPAKSDGPRVDLRQLVNLRPLRGRLRFNRRSRSPDDKTFQAVMKKARDLSEAQGARFVVLTLPHWRPIAVAPPRASTFPDVDAALKALNIQTLDFYSALKAEPDPLVYFPFRLPAHYNVKGYERLGRFVDEALLRKIPELRKQR